MIGGTGPTGPGVVNGLVERGYDVSILHTGRHEVDTIPDSVPHIHTNPFRIAEVEEALGAATFDVVYAMYGRLRDLAPYFVGRCGQFIAVGGIPVYKGYARPAQNWPRGLLNPLRESADRAVGDANDKVAKIVADGGLTLRTAALDVEVDIVNLPGDLATPVRPFLGEEESLHRSMSPGLMISELGYRDKVGVVEAVGLTDSLASAVASPPDRPTPRLSGGSPSLA